MKKKVERVPLNLLGPDAALAERLRVHYEKKEGKTTAITVARKAYRALAAKEFGDAVSS